MSDSPERLTAALAGRYDIVRELGRGGMAVVYLARDLKHGRDVALKVLRPELAASLGTERFLREIRIAAQLTHPHILPLYDSGEADGQLFYVMPYIEGESLRARLDREGQLGVDESLQLVREVGSALNHAHGMNLVHRDIKPENILLSGGHAVLADFGIARAVSAAGGDRLTETGLAVGTPHYMSPEQASGDKAIDGRSDQYALACVLYELLAGEPPFTGPSARAVIARHTMDPVPSLRTVRNTIPVALESSLMKALAKVPADRFQTVQQFVEAVTGSGQQPAAPIATAPRRAWSRGRVAGSAALAVLAAAIVLGRRIDFFSLFTPIPQLRVAVVDFDGLGLESSLAYLTEAIPEFLALALTGEGGGPRALDRRQVTKEWRAVEGTTSDPTQRRQRLADRLGATHVLSGQVIRQRGDSVVVRATLYRGREVVTEADAAGTVASAIALAEAVGVQLLAAAAGEFARLPALMSSSTEAVQIWLRGQRAYRDGEFQRAVELQWDALKVDSTFALAAWNMMKSAQWLERQNPWFREGRRLAWQHRDRLPRPDSLIFVAESFRNSYPEPIGERRSFALYQQAVREYPERWDAWLLYGDYLWHEGGIYIDDGRAKAVDAFEKALALDTLAHDEPWEHLEEHYVMTADWAGFSRLPERHRSRLSGVLRAMMNGDSLEISTWDSLSARYQWPIIGLMQLQAAGAGMADAERLAAILERRAEGGDGNSALVAGTFWLNRGRPDHAIPLLHIADHGGGCGGSPCQEPAMWLQAGLFSDLPADVVQHVRDSLRSPDSEMRLEDINGDWPAWTGLRDRFAGRAWSALWDLHDGDQSEAAETARLARQAETIAESPRAKHFMELYAALLEAAVAVQNGAVDAAHAVARLDSVFDIGVPNQRHAAAWLLVQADLFARTGQPEKALAVIRRQWSRFGEERTQFLPARLLVRARLARQLGLRDEAIRAYDHYLTLRSDPEPALAELVASVRAERAELIGEAGR
jgi:hypothetical protein